MTAMLGSLVRVLLTIEFSVRGSWPECKGSLISNDTRKQETQGTTFLSKTTATFFFNFQLKNLLLF